MSRAFYQRAGAAISNLSRRARSIDLRQPRSSDGCLRSNRETRISADATATNASSTQRIGHRLPVADCRDIDERIGIASGQRTSHQRIREVSDRIQKPHGQLCEPQSAFRDRDPPIDKKQDRHRVVQNMVGDQLPAFWIPDVPQQQRVRDADYRDVCGNRRVDAGPVEESSRFRRRREAWDGQRHRDEDVGQDREVAQIDHQSRGHALAVGRCEP